MSNMEFIRSCELTTNFQMKVLEKKLIGEKKSLNTLKFTEISQTLFLEIGKLKECFTLFEITNLDAVDSFLNC